VGEGRRRDLVDPIVGAMTWGYYKKNIISFLCTVHVSMWVSILMLRICYY